jgi:hypothetical protein
MRVAQTRRHAGEIARAFTRALAPAHSSLQCYAANGDNTLACADVVKALVGCSNALLEKALRGQSM